MGHRRSVSCTCRRTFSSRHVLYGLVFRAVLINFSWLESSRMRLPNWTKADKHRHRLCSSLIQNGYWSLESGEGVKSLSVVLLGSRRSGKETKVEYHNKCIKIRGIQEYSILICQEYQCGEKNDDDRACDHCRIHRVWSDTGNSELYNRLKRN